jgi:DNA polymerase-3 subunit delta'
VSSTTTDTNDVLSTLIDQEKVVTQLRYVVNNPDVLTNAWLFVGPMGSGRSIVAKAFAMCIECEKGGCGVCKTCITIDKNTNPDVTVINTSKLSINVDVVRDLVQTAEKNPTVSPKRIIIIEDADRMRSASSNILLKSIEEPVQNTIWILCAPSDESIISTIRSRCRVVRMNAPSYKSISQHLIKNDSIDEKIARLASKISQGHIGIARRYALNPDRIMRRNQILNSALNIRRASDAFVLAENIMEFAKANVENSVNTTLEKKRADLLNTLGVAEGEAPPAKLKHFVTQLEKDVKLEEKRFLTDIIDITLSDILTIYTDVFKIQAMRAGNTSAMPAPGTPAPENGSASEPALSDTTNTPLAPNSTSSKTLGDEIVDQITNETFYSALEVMSRALSPKQNLKNIELILLAKKRLHSGVKHELLLEAVLSNLKNT